MNIKNLLMMVLSVSLISACTNEEENIIEAELEVYFARFAEEATQRGKTVDFESIPLSAYIENIASRGTLGQCKSYSNGSKTIVVDEPYWNRIDDLQKEYIVFHELGHCVLDKDHDDSQADNGECISIMQSGEGSCKGEYSLQNRETLLNELFN